MRIRPVVPIAALLSTFVQCSAPAGSVPTSIETNIDVAISPAETTDARVDAANTVTDGWQESLPVLLQRIEAYYQNREGAPYSKENASKLIPLTDLLVRIVVNKDGSVQSFQKSDNEKTIDLLAAAAGGEERDLRFNSSYILAKVVDDDNLCVILHRLRQTDLGYSGQVNLLQIAISGTSNAARENVQAAKATAEKLKTSTEGKTAVLVSLLDQIASTREDAAEPLRRDSYCARYNVDTGIATPAETPPAPPSP